MSEWAGAVDPAISPDGGRLAVGTFEQPLSYFQPKFIVEQCIAACKYLGLEVTMNRDLLVDAMENLSAKSETERGKGGARANGDGASHTAAKGIGSQGFSISK